MSVTQPKAICDTQLPACALMRARPRNNLDERSNATAHGGPLAAWAARTPFGWLDWTEPEPDDGKLPVDLVALMRQARDLGAESWLTPFVFLTPFGYFWRRAAVTKTSYSYMWLWLGCFVVQVIVASLLVAAVLANAETSLGARPRPF